MGETKSLLKNYINIIFIYLDTIIYIVLCNILCNIM